MDSPPQRVQARRTLPRLLRDERGLGTIELIVALVLIVALSVSFWNFFGNDVACRFSDAIVSFDDAKRPAATQCVDTASSGTGAKAGGAAGSASGASRGPGTRGGSQTGHGAAAGHGASGSTQAAATPTSAALPAATTTNGALPVAPSPSPQPAPSSQRSPPREPSIGERIESALAAAGRHAVDFTEGVVAGANPLTPLIPVELEPTFGNQVTFGAGQVVGSVVGLLDDAGNVIAGGSGMVASSAVLVLSNGTLVWVALPGFGASTALAGVGVAGAAGHGTNLMQGIDNMSNGENAPSRPSEPSGGGSSEKPPNEPPSKGKPPPQAEQPSSAPAKTESGYVRDYASKNTVNRSASYGSEREARNLARTKLGRDPVQVEPGKLRSSDGRWQYRGKPEDLAGHGTSDSPHIHLERLDPKTGEVLENWHLRW